MQKIERDLYPNQVGSDYPTMTEDELMAEKSRIAKWADEDCHLYLWTTHEQLPFAFRLVEHWGFRYECLLTWLKNRAITPYSWMYSTEHVLFCRKRSLKLLKRGERLDFHANVREHSRKPEEFYDLVRRVSPELRLDVYARERRPGFDHYGNEPNKFVNGLDGYHTNRIAAYLPSRILHGKKSVSL